MSGFDADWLALREPADVAARAPKVLDAAAVYCAALSSSPLTICDLGSGTGASVAAFSGFFEENQHWCLVDQDAANLERAVTRYAEDDAYEGVTVSAKVHDLAVNPAPWEAATDLVTATALFDLTSKNWLTDFTERLVEDAVPLLTTMTYDGRHIFFPSLSLDSDMNEAFNVHQCGDKGFGPAAGPAAVEFLGDLLGSRGYTVLTAESSWHLSPEHHRALISALLDGWAEAVIEADLMPEGKVRDWRAARAKNPPQLQVGHTDLFASPTM